MALDNNSGAAQFKFPPGFEACRTQASIYLFQLFLYRPSEGALYFPNTVMPFLGSLLFNFGPLSITGTVSSSMRIEKSTLTSQRAHLSLGLSTPSVFRNPNARLQPRPPELQMHTSNCLLNLDFKQTPNQTPDYIPHLEFLTEVNRIIQTSSFKLKAQVL